VKLLMVMADTVRLDLLRDKLMEMGAPGYTVLPVIEGAGQTGVRRGDRVHPGALAMVLVVAEDALAGTLFEGLKRCRDECGDTVTRIFVMPVESRA
jgi:nitrogen regulatory protein PII